MLNTENNPSLLTKSWDAPKGVRYIITTRRGGFSPSPYNSLNLSYNVGDWVENVEKNRGMIFSLAPSTPRFPKQVHGTKVLNYAEVDEDTPGDAVYTSNPKQPCGILVADCLPVIIASEEGNEIAVAHAGWRGLSAGILETTLAKFKTTPERLDVFIGPGIGPNHFEVGDDVFAQFTKDDSRYESAFTKISAEKWLANLSLLAELRLRKLKVEKISKSDYCTYENGDLFFSYRRDKTTGRIAAIVWIEQ